MVGNPIQSPDRRASKRTHWQPWEYAGQAAAKELGLRLQFQGPADDRRWSIFARGGPLLGEYQYASRRYSVGERRGVAHGGWRSVLLFAAGKLDNPSATPTLRT